MMNEKQPLIAALDSSFCILHSSLLIMAYKKFTASEDMLKPDARFNSKLVSKFINCLMWDGKKTVAQKVFYDAMGQVSKKMKDVQPLELFETAISNVKPYVEVRSKRVGGANYQVPMQVN